MAAAIGTSPPAMNRLRQPMSGSTWIPSTPASVAPSGTQTMVMVTATGRRRAGTYSAASVAAFGIAPPRPMPARNRRPPSSPASGRTPRRRSARQTGSCCRAARCGGRCDRRRGRPPGRRPSSRDSRARRPARRRGAAGATPPSAWESRSRAAGCRCRRRRWSAPPARRASADSTVNRPESSSSATLTAWSRTAIYLRLHAWHFRLKATTFAQLPPEGGSYRHSVPFRLKAETTAPLAPWHSGTLAPLKDVYNPMDRSLYQQDACVPAPVIRLPPQRLNS